MYEFLRLIDWFQPKYFIYSRYCLIWIFTRIDKENKVRVEFKKPDQYTINVIFLFEILFLEFMVLVFLVLVLKKKKCYFFTAPLPPQNFMGN